MGLRRRDTAWVGPVSVAALLAALTGCPPQQPASEPEVPTVAGATCAAFGDCPTDQVCSQGSCRYRATSAAGEVLAHAAKSQFEQGDLAGAVGTYEQALEAFDGAKAPVPAEVACGSAEAALKQASSPDERERAATRADRCLRASLPGHPARARVLRALTRLRYEGLDLAHFDAPEPAGRFFTNEPERPTLDAIQVALDLPDAEEPGFEKIAEALRDHGATRAIADCFVRDWERSHERSVRGSLAIKFETDLRDMGHYDVYAPTVEISTTPEATGPFGSCVAEALSSVVAEAGPKNVGRRVAWQQPFEVAARVQ